MAYFLRSPRSGQNLSTRIEDGRMVFVHSAPLVSHDRCVPEGYENHSHALAAAWETVKAEVRADNAKRGDVRRNGEPFDYPTADTPRELVERLNAAGQAANAWRDPISTLAGAGWDWCWAPLYSDDPESAPPCYECGAACVGRG